MSARSCLFYAVLCHIPQLSSLPVPKELKSIKAESTPHDRFHCSPSQRNGLVASVYASHAVGSGFASQPIIPKTIIEWYKLPTVWKASMEVGVWHCNPTV